MLTPDWQITRKKSTKMPKQLKMQNRVHVLIERPASKMLEKRKSCSSETSTFALKSDRC